ncbi:xylulokinase [Rouxiella badensis]|jgi:xylulokinase|uniref:xylulokinase n=1 Tax=Rouxiella badensis TaxID=1646377 RepID=UPI001D159619|nr:xylulokinase [Rouxiella badensis]MCC3720967.1 xylulokinase [Rouxiella badensis]MCC3729584.1 xylulokinase [Rouxiella badensis]MCC3741252.1 xylulokinase [Rouxiella badensis]WAT09751.1 xylulokinase [Rouxiella badensis]
MYLGLDLGTSEIKALVLDAEGKVIASAGEALEVQRPRPHWSEQRPDDWWKATQKVVARLRDQVPQAWANIVAIGLSGQMHGAVLLGREGEVLRPAILWNDTRSARECELLTQAAPQLHQLAGNLAMPGFTAPKLLWVARHEPEIFSQIATVLLPKDYLRWKMSGDKVSDMSDAAGTLWLDVAKRDWSDTLLDACGLSRDQMPRLVEGSAVSGVLNRDIARAWGLNSEVIIAGGGGDNAASAIGIGAVEPGDAFISLGTSGVLFAVNPSFSPNPNSAVHAFCHALPDRWHQMSVMLTAASALRWYCQLIGSHETTLLAEVAQLTQAEKRQAPLFLPYLSGERTPHNDPLAVGAFHGMTHSTQRAALGYAVLEGVAFGMADGLSVLKQSGTQLSQCSLVGGGARSDEWAQLIADALNLTITTHQDGEAGGALGAARLGWLAAGGEQSKVCRKPLTKKTFSPDAARHQVLQSRLATWRKLYQQQVELRR